MLYYTSDTISPCWRNTVKVKYIFAINTSWQLERRANLLFREDVWLGETYLEDNYP